MMFLSWFSCETFAERVSRWLDGELAWHEKPSFYFRLAVCMTSRRFRRQMCAMEGILKNYSRCESGKLPSEAVDNMLCHESLGGLSKEAVERMEQALRQG